MTDGRDGTVWRYFLGEAVCPDGPRLDGNVATASLMMLTALATSGVC